MSKLVKSFFKNEKGLLGFEPANHYITNESAEQIEKIRFYTYSKYFILKQALVAKPN